MKNFRVRIPCEVWERNVPARLTGQLDYKEGHLDFRVKANNADEAIARVTHALHVLVDQCGDGTVGDPRPETKTESR